MSDLLDLFKYLMEYVISSCIPTTIMFILASIAAVTLDIAITLHDNK